MEKNKNNVKTIILIIIGILIALLIAMGVFFKLKVVGDPVTLTTMALEKLGDSFDKGNSPLVKISKIIDENDTYQMSLTGNATLPMEYGKLAFDMNVEDATELDEAIMDLSIKLDGTNALYLDGKLDKSALYFALAENASKYYYLTDVKYPDEIEGIEDINLDDFLDKFAESFKESFTKDDFVESEKEITVNDEKITAKQMSLKLTAENTKPVVEKFLNKILADEDLMEVLVELTGTTKAEIQTSFEELIANYGVDSENGDLTYNIYVYKNTAVRYELTDGETSIYYDDYKNTEFTMNMIDEYAENITLVIKEEKDNVKINLNSSNLVIEGNISEEKYDLTMTAEGTTIKLSGTEEFKEISREKEAEITSKGNLEITSEGATITVPFEFTVNVKAINNITKKDIINKVDINNMTEEQSNEFYTELSQIPLFSSLMTTSTPSYESGMEYDTSYETSVY